MKLRRRMQRDLERDIREHIEMETRDNLERGMSQEEARSAALRKFGNVALVMEDTRAVWQWMWLERLVQDLRYAVRTLRRNPGFAAVAILTLALGIGMNTAVFSVVNAVLIRPLSYPNPERLLWLANYNEAFKMEAVAGPDFLDWREQAKSFDKMACYAYNDMTIATADSADQSMVAPVSDDFWPIIGVRPELGRLFAPGERDAIILSHRLFVRRFGGDPEVVGKIMSLNGRPMTVTGVLPERFRFQFPMPQRAGVDPKEIEAYIPTDVTPQTQSRNRGAAILNVVGKLKPGVTADRARAELEAIQARLARENPGGFYNLVKLRVVPAQRQLNGNSRPALVILSAAVAFVLLIACANLANLALARAASRQKEIAIRAAVGAGRARVVRQFLAESVVLALAGGVAGLFLARWGIGMLIRFGPQGVPRLAETRLDGAVLAFTLGVSLLTGLLFGFGPAFFSVRSNLNYVLKEGGHSAATRSAVRARTFLVAGELAVALLLLIGAGLMAKSFWHMNERPSGFDPEHTLVLKVSLSGPSYRAMPQQLAYFEEALRRLAAAPGVQTAGLAYSPVRGFAQVEGASPLPPGQAPQAIYYSTSADYFHAIGMRLLAGRWMADNEPTEVVLINEAFARRVFGNADPIGKRIRVPRQSPPPQATIVGVVSDLKYSRLDAEPGPEVYFPYRQSPFLRAHNVIVRVAGDPVSTAAVVRKLIGAIDRTQPVYDVQTLDQALAESIAPRRFNFLLLTVFAVTALLLAIVGVYGVMSYAVTQRTHEIGVRMALGARRGEVIGMVVRQGMMVTAAGVLIGTAAALGLTRPMASLLYDVKPTDGYTFAVVSGLLTAAAFAACCVPAFRAARVDPILALRYE
jgi:predicted permease